MNKTEMLNTLPPSDAARRAQSSIEARARAGRDLAAMLGNLGPTLTALAEENRRSAELDAQAAATLARLEHAIARVESAMNQTIPEPEDARPPTFGHLVLAGLIASLPTLAFLGVLILQPSQPRFPVHPISAAVAASPAPSTPPPAFVHGRGMPQGGARTR